MDLTWYGNRERDKRNGFTIPPNYSVRQVVDALARPAWTWDLLTHDVYSYANIDADVPAEALADFINAQMARHAGSGIAPAARAVSSCAAGARLHVGRRGLGRLRVAPTRSRRQSRDEGHRAAGRRAPRARRGLRRRGAASFKPVSADANERPPRPASVGRGAAARRRDPWAPAGVWVSNHGGRQLDGAPAPIDVLAPIRAAVGDDFDVILDGGVQRGTDILKALALGADGVGVGKAFLYGLGAGGRAGVEKALDILETELRRAMGLAGVGSVAEARAMGAGLVRDRAASGRDARGARGAPEPGLI